MEFGNCGVCKVELTKDNCKPSAFRRGCGECRTCTALRQARRRKEIPEVFKASRKRYQESLKGRYAHLRGQAVFLNRIMEISFDEYCLLISGGVCKYCGTKLNRTGYGLDRVNHLDGYTVSNCVPCCRWCNQKKGRLEYLGFSSSRAIELLLELNKLRRN